MYIYIHIVKWRIICIALLINACMCVHYPDPGVVSGSWGYRGNGVRIQHRELQAFPRRS